nr:hypothetical protein [Streptomyces sp. 5-6(2022)]
MAGTRLLDQVTADHPGIRKVWVDGGYRHHLVEHAAALGWCLAAGSTQRV